MRTRAGVQPAREDDRARVLSSRPHKSQRSTGGRGRANRRRISNARSGLVSSRRHVQLRTRSPPLQTCPTSVTSSQTGPPGPGTRLGSISPSTTIAVTSGAASWIACSMAILERHRRRRAAVAASQAGAAPCRPRRCPRARRCRRATGGTAASSRGPAHAGLQVQGVEAVQEQDARDQLVAGQLFDDRARGRPFAGRRSRGRASAPRRGDP